MAAMLCCRVARVKARAARLHGDCIQTHDHTKTWPNRMHEWRSGWHLNCCSPCLLCSRSMSRIIGAAHTQAVRVAPAGAGPRTGSACSRGRSSCTGPGRAGSASPGPTAPRPGSGPRASTGTCRTRCRARCTARRGTRTRSRPRPPTCACRRGAAPASVLGAPAAARAACER
jgi:hypothetical protein